MKEKILTIHDTCFPGKRKNIAKFTSNPWLCNNLRILLRKQNRLHIQCKRKPTTTLKKKYSTYRRYVKKMLREAEQEYLRNFCNNIKDEPKKFWRFVNYKRKEREYVSSLKHEGATFTEDHQKAKILNEQFKSVFLNIKHNNFQDGKSPMSLQSIRKAQNLIPKIIGQCH